MKKSAIPKSVLMFSLVVSVFSAAHAQMPIGSLIESIDLKCYRIESDIQDLNLPLVLDHLNPVLKQLGAPPEHVIVHEPQQLCVPVMKNGRIPPPPVFDFVR